MQPRSFWHSAQVWRPHNWVTSQCPSLLMTEGPSASRKHHKPNWCMTQLSQKRAVLAQSFPIASSLALRFLSHPYTVLGFFKYFILHIYYTYYIYMYNICVIYTMHVYLCVVYNIYIIYMWFKRPPNLPIIHHLLFEIYKGHLSRPTLKVSNYSPSICILPN